MLRVVSCNYGTRDKLQDTSFLGQAYFQNNLDMLGYATVMAKLYIHVVYGFAASLECSASILNTGYECDIFEIILVISLTQTIA